MLLLLKLYRILSSTQPFLNHHMCTLLWRKQSSHWACTSFWDALDWWWWWQDSVLLQQAILVTLCIMLSSVRVQSTLNTFLYYCQLLLTLIFYHPTQKKSGMQSNYMQILSFSSVLQRKNTSSHNYSFH